MSAGRAAWVLFAGDALCLAAFVLLGMRLHGTLEAVSPAVRFALNGGPLLAAWAVAGLAVGAFRLVPAQPLRAVWARTLLAWLLAAPYGLLARAVLLGSPAVPVVFAVLTIALAGSLLLAWRGLFVWVGRRLARPAKTWQGNSD